MDRQILIFLFLNFVLDLKLYMLNNIRQSPEIARNNHRIWFVFLSISFLSISCQEWTSIEQGKMLESTLTSEYQYVDTIPITLSNIDEVLWLASQSFYVEHWHDLMTEDSVKAILQTYGERYYRDIYHDLLWNVYIPNGCKWADIQINNYDKTICQIKYGEDIKPTLSDCRKIFTLSSPSPSPTSTDIYYRKVSYDCLYKEDRMTVEMTRKLELGREISINLIFIVPNSKETDRI